MSQASPESKLIILQGNGADQLAVRYFPSASGKGKGIVLIHGSVENGRIFYSKSGKGLAPYLASQGYEVFVPDLRGRGESRPLINSESRFGNLDIIKHDFVLYEQLAKEYSDPSPLIWMGHSWGGVLIFQALFRAFIQQPSAVVCWGTKRRISVLSLRRLVMVEGFWVTLSFLLKKRYGYLPAKNWGMGSDNESKATHAETLRLVWDKKWIDPSDQWDYRSPRSYTKLPPALYLTGSHDHVLGHAKDVRIFMKECGYHPKELFLCGKDTGYTIDYNHISLLTHPLAGQELYPKVLSWLQRN
jgi:predicted alpha/beta hydrolase